MTLAIDASTPLPWISAGGGTHTPTSNAFSPPAGSVVWVQVYSNSHSNLMTSPLTDSLTALKWESVANFQDIAGGACHEAWFAYVPSAPGSITVSGAYTLLTQCTVTVIVWNGASPVQSGNATATWSSTTSSVISMSLNTTAPGSQVVMTGDENSGVTPTPVSGQTMTINGTGTFETTFDQWTQVLNTPAGAKGASVTMGISAPTTADSTGFCVEVLAGPQINSSTAAQAQGSSHVPTTAAFSPPAGSVVIVPVFNGSNTTLATSMTDSATALSWHRIPGAAWQDTTNGTAIEMWYAPVVTAPGSITVSTNTYAVVMNWVIDAIVLTGVAASQSGNAVVSAYMTTANLSQVITTRGQDSLILTAALYPNATAPTPASGQTLTINGVSTFTGWLDSWLQTPTALIPAVGTNVTMATTQGGAASYSAMTVEILAATLASGPYYKAHSGSWTTCFASKKAHGGAWV